MIFLCQALFQAHSKISLFLVYLFHTDPYCKTHSGKKHPARRISIWGNVEPGAASVCPGAGWGVGCCHQRGITTSILCSL